MQHFLLTVLMLRTLWQNRQRQRYILPGMAFIASSCGVLEYGASFVEARGYINPSDDSDNCAN